MEANDLTFWVEYEAILYRIATQSPKWKEISGAFLDLLKQVSNPDFKAICYRNIGLVFIESGDNISAVESFLGARETAQQRVLKFQVSLAINLLGRQVDWVDLYQDLMENSSSEEERSYVSFLRDGYTTLCGLSGQARVRGLVRLLVGGENKPE